MVTMPLIGTNYGPATAAGDPSTNALLVTPSDTAPLPFITNRIWVGTAGNVAVVMMNASGASGPPLLAATTFSAVPAGTMLSIRVKQVMATNTTAIGIVALQ